MKIHNNYPIFCKILGILQFLRCSEVIVPIRTTYNNILGKKIIDQKKENRLLANLVRGIFSNFRADYINQMDGCG